MPYDSLNVADIGDVSLRHYYTPYAVEDIREAYRSYIKDGCKMLTMGGDHTITYPILQAYKVSAHNCSYHTTGLKGVTPSPIPPYRPKRCHTITYPTLL